MVTKEECEKALSEIRQALYMYDYEHSLDPFVFRYYREQLMILEGLYLEHFKEHEDGNCVYYLASFGFNNNNDTSN